MFTGRVSDLEDERRKYLTPQEVADYLGISRRTAYELIYRGDIAAKKFGRSVRVAKDELLRYERGSDYHRRDG